MLPQLLISMPQRTKSTYLRVLGSWCLLMKILTIVAIHSTENFLESLSQQKQTLLNRKIRVLLNSSTKLPLERHQSKFNASFDRRRTCALDLHQILPPCIKRS